ncbi:hypothetical protein [Thermogemmatispora onikobensis]|uniref:hypothetical protein n=1 Tax=Thermogemmatispora onikobensis TaxID=732234 RepID=UPI00114D1C68|nr:hypothetical protein [Thermogemmatispora onikobensis]
MTRRTPGADSQSDDYNRILQRFQKKMLDTLAFQQLDEYKDYCTDFIKFMKVSPIECVVSSSHPPYMFLNYQNLLGIRRITRPINRYLFINDIDEFEYNFEVFKDMLEDLRLARGEWAALSRFSQADGLINRVVYTIQQIIGSISDSLESSNQSRKRTGQLFEGLIKQIFHEVGLKSSPRTIRLPVPDTTAEHMSYELDIVLSLEERQLSSSESYLHSGEIIASIKTTSKDRLDKIFLDKYLLDRLLKRKTPVVAIFLHDIQRATIGDNEFCVRSTFKRNHFLVYSYLLTRLEGVYYVDYRPELGADQRLQGQVKSFQDLLFHDLWLLLNQPDQPTGTS